MIIKKYNKPGMVVYACNPHTQETGARRLLVAWMLLLSLVSKAETM